MKKIHVVLLVFCAIVSTIIIALYWLAAAKEAQENKSGFVVVQDAQMTLYYGETCPHCKIVEEWLVQHDPENTLRVARKEVYYDRDNAAALGTTAQSCGLSTDSVGVPFLVVEGDCYIGDGPIIAVLQQRMEETP